MDAGEKEKYAPVEKEEEEVNEDNIYDKPAEISDMKNTKSSKP